MSVIVITIAASFKTYIAKMISTSYMCLPSKFKTKILFFCGMSKCELAVVQFISLRLQSLSGRKNRT